MCGRHEERLIDEIFKVRRYQKLARPVRRESEAVDVVFGLSLQQIIAVVSLSVCLSLSFCSNMVLSPSLDQISAKLKFNFKPGNKQILQFLSTPVIFSLATFVVRMT